jgi:hypothetical protein
LRKHFKIFITIRLYIAIYKIYFKESVNYFESVKNYAKILTSNPDFAGVFQLSEPNIQFIKFRDLSWGNVKVAQD